MKRTDRKNATTLRRKMGVALVKLGTATKRINERYEELQELKRLADATFGDRRVSDVKITKRRSRRQPRAA